jgi:putative tryptophan/tyrosine transport system substrate-binding protein
LNKKRTALAGTIERRKERKQFCGFSARARFHTAWTQLGHPTIWTSAENLLTLGLRASGALQAMRRREFITLVGGAAASVPFAARAQQKAPVVGFIGGGTAEAMALYAAAFRQGLRETGYEGRNLLIEARWAEGQYDRLPALAADLVERQVTVIAAASTPAALAAKTATSTIPIVFTIVSDPVQIGLVASLNRPGGNVTGVTQLNIEIGPKLLELMHEVVPTATSIGLLVNPTNPNGATLASDLAAAAQQLGITLHVLHASTEFDIDTAFATLAKLGAGGIVLGGDAFISSQGERLAALALRHGLPSIYQTRLFPVRGGLMGYGGSATDAYHQAGIYTGRILNGEKPADLPVVQSTKVELTINLKTAKALGLTVPLSLLGRADEVIE